MGFARRKARRRGDVSRTPDGQVTRGLYQRDALEFLRSRRDNEFSACVTDPPYEIGYMSKQWDSSGVAFSTELWSEVLRVLKPGAFVLAFGAPRTFHRLVCAIEDAGFEVRDFVDWIYGTGFAKPQYLDKQIRKGTGRRRLARRWRGWSNGLKPAHEPIVVARVPFSGSTYANVLKHGTGAVHVDACRAPEGRYPSNVILSPGHGLPEEFAPYYYCAKPSRREREHGLSHLDARTTDDGRAKTADNPYQRGATARKNDHPTVKPLTLMRYLVRLITPPGGTVLDPFVGSGTTAVAAIREDLPYCAVDKDARAIEIAKGRIARAYRDHQEEADDNES